MYLPFIEHPLSNGRSCAKHGAQQKWSGICSAASEAIPLPGLHRRHHSPLCSLEIISPLEEPSSGFTSSRWILRTVTWLVTYIYIIWELTPSCLPTLSPPKFHISSPPSRPIIIYCHPIALQLPMSKIMLFILSQTIISNNHPTPITISSPPTSLVLLSLF